MIPVTLAVTKSVIDSTVAVDAFESPDLALALCDFILQCDDIEARELPSAVSASSGVLQSDLGRLRALVDFALQLDMYECARDFVDLAREHREPHLVLSTVSMLMNPAVDPEFRLVAINELVGSLSDKNMREIADIRRGEGSPRSDLSRLLDSQAWPGKYSAEDLRRVAPVVYVVGDPGTDKNYWQVAALLVAAGARVRRLGHQVQHLPQPRWASPLMPVVTWSGDGVARWRRVVDQSRVAVVQAPDNVTDPLESARFINRVATALPPGSRFRTTEPDGPELREPFALDALSEGAFDVAEMQFLGAASRGVLQRLSRTAMQPMTSADVHRWRFDQLISLRLVQGMKARNFKTRPDVDRILHGLSDLILATEKSRVGIDAAGSILSLDERGVATVDSGQQAFPEVISLDQAFRPFEIGGGVVPNLLKPTANTNVDPRVLGGTPALRGRRVAARSIAEVFRKRGENAMRSAFPELSGFELREGVRLGNRIQSLSGE